MDGVTLERMRHEVSFLPWCCRTGWLEDEPCRPTGRLEYRPAAELGPVIVCLDTSGSMSGARETVAKVTVLLCSGFLKPWDS